MFRFLAPGRAAERTLEEIAKNCHLDPSRVIHWGKNEARQNTSKDYQEFLLLLDMALNDATIDFNRAMKLIE